MYVCISLAGILDLSLFSSPSGMDEYCLIMFCTMGGAFIWLAIATKYSLPVSTTHSLIGSLIGVGLLSKGFNAVQLNGLSMIGKLYYRDNYSYLLLTYIYLLLSITYII